MARPKKETFHEAREEVANEVLQERPVVDAEKKLAEMIEITKRQHHGKQYCMFARVHEDGSPGVFIMSAHQTSLSAQLVRKYQRKGFRLVYSTIKPIKSDDRVMKLWQETNFTSVPRNEVSPLSSASVEEMNKEQLRKELIKQGLEVSNVDLEMRDE